MTENNNRESLFVALIAILLIVLAGLSYYVYQMNANKNLLMGELADKQEELKLTYSHLDSVSILLKETLRQKEEMGEKDDSLRAVIAQLEEEKSALQNANTLSVGRYNEIKSKISQYQNLLTQKDREIKELQIRNESLGNKNSELERDKKGLKSEVKDLEKGKNLIESKLNEASQLKVYSIRTLAINKKGKKKTGEAYKIRQLKKLQIECKVGENKAAEVGNRKILMRIISPDKTVLGGAESGSFNFQSNEIAYSIAKEILFDTNEQNVTVIYQNDKKYQKGKYTIEIYTEELLMGKGNFIVK